MNVLSASTFLLTVYRYCTVIHLQLTYLMQPMKITQQSIVLVVAEVPPVRITYPHLREGEGQSSSPIAESFFQNFTINLPERRYTYSLYCCLLIDRHCISTYVFIHSSNICVCIPFRYPLVWQNSEQCRLHINLICIDHLCCLMIQRGYPKHT